MIDQIWQFLSQNRDALIIGVIIAIVIALLRNLLRRLWQAIFSTPEKKKEKDNKLKVHFKELKDEAKSIMSEANLIEMYGAVVASKGSVPLYHPDFVGIELPKFPENFTAHFPEIAKKWIECIGRILEHSKSYKQLVQNIRNSFKSEGIPIVDINHPPNVSPYIYDNIFPPLFNWWKDCGQSKANPWPNFEQIETKRDFGPNHLVVAGWNSQAIAYAETDSDKRRCKEAIGRVAKNKEYENEAAKTIELANERMKDVRTFKGQLTDTLDDIEKFWPGTKKYKFKEEKNCSRCKELFH